MNEYWIFDIGYWIMEYGKLNDESTLIQKNIRSHQHRKGQKPNPNIFIYLKRIAKQPSLISKS